MKFKKLLAVTALNLGLVGLAHANIVVEAPYSGKGDVCSQIAGSWNGKGEAKENLFIAKLDCWYTGTMEILSPEAGKMTIHALSLKLDPSHSSSSICPATESLSDMNGTCINDKIIIDTKDVADLNGSIGPDGKNAHVTGNVTFSLAGIKFHPDVIMDITKADKDK